MANRFPLILDTQDGNKIKEIPNGDNLNLQGSSILNVENIQATGIIDAAEIRISGSLITAQSMLDLTDTPSSYQGFENNFVKIKSDASGVEFVGFDSFGDITLGNVTLAGNILPEFDNSGVIGSSSARLSEIWAVELRGNLKSLSGEIVFDATTGFINYASILNAPTQLSAFENDVGYLTVVDLIEGELEINITNTGDLIGSVFADDSTLLIDGINGKIVGPLEGNSFSGTLDFSNSIITNFLYDLSVSITNEQEEFSNFGTLEIGIQIGDSQTQVEVIVATPLTETSKLKIAELQSNIITGDSLNITNSIEIINGTTTFIGNLDQNYAADGYSAIGYVNTQPNNNVVFNSAVDFNSTVNFDDAIVDWASIVSDVLINNGLPALSTQTLDIAGSVFSQDDVLLVDGVNGVITGTLTGVWNNLGNIFTVNGEGIQLNATTTAFIVDNLGLAFNNSVDGDDINLAMNNGNINLYNTGTITLSSQGSFIASTGSLAWAINGPATFASQDLTWAINGPATFASQDLIWSINGSVNLVANNMSIDSEGITADLRGSVFGDDSTVLIDGVNGKIVGPLEGNSFSGTLDFNGSTWTGVPGTVIVNSISNESPFINSGSLEFSYAVGDLGAGFNINFSTPLIETSSVKIAELQSNIITGDSLNITNSIEIINGTTTFIGNLDIANGKTIQLGQLSVAEINELGQDSTSITGKVLYNSTIDRFQFFQAGNWVSLINNGSTAGQLLAWDGSYWNPIDPEITAGTIENASTLNGFSGSYYLDYNNFVNTPVIPTVLTDLGIVDGANTQVLTTNGSGVFSFQNLPSTLQLTDFSVDVTAVGAANLVYNNTTGVFSYTPPNLSNYALISTVPTTLLDLSIVDGTAGQLLRANGNGTFGFVTVAVGETNQNAFSNIAVSGQSTVVADTTTDTVTLVAGAGVAITTNATTDTITITNTAISLASRASLSGSTGSISNAATAVVNLTGYKGYMLYKVQTSAAAWVRLYVSAAARTADAGRTQGQDPLPGSGVIAEVITTGAETVIIAPGVIGFNNELPVTNVIPMAVTNLSGGIADIAITLTAVEMEV